MCVCVLFYLTGEDSSRLFCNEIPGCGRRTKFTLTELQEKGFLENNQLRVQIYMNVLEVVHQVKSTKNDMVDFHGVQIIASQVSYLRSRCSHFLLLITSSVLHSNIHLCFVFPFLEPLAVWSSGQDIQRAPRLWIRSPTKE